ncbi:hypothetical protein AVDCRST_MAG94-3087 [uncultured Leptolyngbya sp.]|uniref:Uncharacterized protein n=1 Tax=uncultured Leptolyngbya sp. TaxID=332963 RepID=A0A6J4MDD1_9CYAN|nr:hypothetical protein AVDCRST_MAG94-3087 [uncultured Leptolyngbya sp.]
MLVKADVKSGSMNIESSQPKAKVLVTLRAWAADYYTSFAKDRQL